MMILPKSRYPLAMDNWDKKELKAIQSVVDSNKFTMGAKTKAFEHKISEYSDRKHTIMVNSGSSANFLLLAALMVRRKLEGLATTGLNLVVPAVSWSTTFTPSFFFDLELRFVDVDEKSFGLSLQNVKDACDRNTIGIFAVNLLGSACDLESLSTFCKNKHIALLEDNCESLGATLNGKQVGNFGIAATQSSFYSHHINTMEGGWITTDDDFFADLIRSLRAHGWTREISVDSHLRKGLEDDWFTSQFQFILPGLNFRPTEIQAAIGLVQIEKLDRMLKIRRDNADRFVAFASEFRDIDIQVPLGQSSWFAFALIFGSKTIRDRVAVTFRDMGIECRPIVAGNFIRQPVVKLLKYSIHSNITNSEKIHNCGLYIGNHPIPLDKQLDFTFATLRKLGIE